MSSAKNVNSIGLATKFGISVLVAATAGGILLYSTEENVPSTHEMLSFETERVENQIQLVKNRIPKNELAALGEIIAPSESASTGELIHAMHAFSHTKYDPTSPDWKQYLKALLEPDPRGQLRISRTRFGVRFVNAAYVHFDGESHDRQVIAELAVLGVPLNTPINIGKSTFLVEDLITDAEAMFQLHGEFEWAVIALFSYMPSRNKIVDRFGRVYTIEQLVDALFARTPGTGSCVGTHVIQALLVLERVSLRPGSQIDKTIGLKISSYLDELEHFLCENQTGSGAVSPNWGKTWICSRRYIQWANKYGESNSFRQFSELPVDELDMLLSTSHHVEWLSLRNTSRKQLFEFREQANKFLYSTMRKFLSQYMGLPKNNKFPFCQLSHSYHALVILNVGEDDNVNNIR